MPQAVQSSGSVGFPLIYRHECCTDACVGTVAKVASSLAL